MEFVGDWLVGPDRLVELVEEIGVYHESELIRETGAKRESPGADEEWANQFNNYGNLESAEGNYESALSYFSRAKKIRLQLSQDAIVPPGVTYMTTGRALFLMQSCKEALAVIEISLFWEPAGAWHDAYGTRKTIVRRVGH
jgi:tetratricopeptide (TPR) repeat protein